MLNSEETLSQLFESIDTSKDGLLQRAEFTEALMGLRINLSFKEIEALFNKLDLDNSGDVSYHEFIGSFADVNLH